MTVENVAGLAPELEGAKKGQGSKPLASASERFTSHDVEAFEVPGGREENWRFTPLRRLRGLHDGSAPFDGTAVVEITGLRNPCVQLNGVAAGLMAAVLDRDAQGNLIRKAGVMGIVLAGGEVRPGDTIRVELPPAPHQPLAPV